MTTVNEVPVVEAQPGFGVEIDSRVALLQDPEAPAAEVNQALGSLYDENCRIIGKIAARMGVPYQDLDDIAQDVFLRAWRSRDTYKPTHKYGAWLAKITHNVVLDRVRKASCSPSLVDVATELEDQASGDPDIGVQVEFEELYEGLLGKIKPEFADAWLLYLQDLPMKQIAEQLGIPRNTTVTRIHRAKKALRAILENGEVTV